MYAGLADQGAKAPIVAFPSGDESYWHDRADGNWADYVMKEVIPPWRSDSTSTRTG